MSQSMGNILNLPIPAVPVRLAAVAAFAVTLTDRRKGSPARADPYPGRENSAAGNFGLRARRGIFWHFSCKAVINFRWCQSTDKDKGDLVAAVGEARTNFQHYSRTMPLLHKT